MAHFALIGDDNIVVNVVVVLDEQEHRGQEFLADDLGLGGTWIQTSYNTKNGVHLLGGTPLRKNHASVGSIYDPELDVFKEPESLKPYSSWVYNENFVWVAPTDAPAEEINVERIWNEETLSWDLEKTEDPDA